MKKKIVGILVITLLITTTIVSATRITIEENTSSIYNDGDVPIWEVGDSWTYNVQEYQYRYNPDGTVNALLNHNYTSIFTVIEEKEDSYIGETTSENIDGSFNCKYQLTFTPFTKISARIEFKKSDLSIISSTFQIKGLVKWYLPSIGISIPAFYSDTYERSFSPSLTYLPFPLSEGKTGIAPGGTLTGSEKMKIYFGIIKLVDAEFTIEYPETEYQCEIATITIPAGTYEAYNVSTDEGAHNYSYSYYVPELGEIVKESYYYEYGETGKPYSYYESELISTTYKP
jgi:hypothetical protein